MINPTEPVNLLARMLIEYAASRVGKPDPDEIINAVKDKEGNRQNFWNMLSFAIPLSGYRPPQGRQVQILNLACGSCLEGGALNAYFGNRNYGDINPEVIMTGVDSDELCIASARESYPQPNFRFIVDDLQAPNRLEEYPSKADVVVIRHQQLLSQKSNWRPIFQQAIERVSDDGIILITSYGEPEHSFMVSGMEHLGAELVMSETVPNAKSTGYPGTFIDGKVAIFRRPNEESFLYLSHTT